MTKAERREIGALFLSIFLVSVCSITYQLLIGALSSYLFGDSVTQFSVTIGLFLISMGAGSYLSRFFRKNLLTIFISVEIALSIFGGFSLILLYSFYTFTKIYTLLFICITMLLGTLTGLEIPLVTRIMRNYGSIRKGLSSVLAFDYFGGLIASLIFPFVLLPYFGLIRTSFMTGIINLAAPTLIFFIFKTKERFKIKQKIAAMMAATALMASLFLALPISSFFEKQLYQDKIIFSKQTPFQKVILTQWHNDTRLYLNGNLQFSSIDEYRYHESLVHPAALACLRLETVLVLGGGDGLAARELLKYPTIKKIILVDIDRVVTDLGKTHPLLRRLNKNALQRKKINIINNDAFKYLEKNANTLFDLIIADFPDPNNATLAKLYSKEFFIMVHRRLAKGGVFITQSSSPFFAKEAFWTINNTLKTVFPYVLPIHVYVPAFGEWGFNIAQKTALQPKLQNIPAGLRFFSKQTHQAMINFPKDIQKQNKTYKINSLNNPILHSEYKKGWNHFN